ncbi:TetR/AcrR family transcriptional regulator C-terminal domain-containing protein [Streptomyces sp. PSRA5]|uniref:TetR/AcrR family transcriptional regulator C-terminal domain-containing protein n=1 Tax=Streptomyces panacea TaxID=3035064 RepID=UPI00339BFFE0
MDAAVLLVGHVRGVTQQAHPAGGPEGNPEAQLGAILGDLTRSHGESSPALAAALASAVESDGRDQAWEFGLQRVLDGLAALIEQRAG